MTMENLKKFDKFNEELNNDNWGKYRMPTAEEYLTQNTSIGGFLRDEIEEAMIEFAKLHVEAALIRAHKNMQLPDEDLEFTMDAYPLTNIK